MKQILNENELIGKTITKVWTPLYATYLVLFFGDEYAVYIIDHGYELDDSEIEFCQDDGYLGGREKQQAGIA